MDGIYPEQDFFPYCVYLKESTIEVYGQMLVFREWVFILLSYKRILI
jgi:hypothetical protein